MNEFQKELEVLLNKYSQEMPSNTSDFILAQFLVGCLKTWNGAILQRELWYEKH